MAVSDRWFAADLHRRPLPSGFFARLGTPFMRRYYRSFAQSPWAICLVAEIRGCPAGLLVGTIDNAQHYRFVTRRHGWRLALAGLAGLVRAPSLARCFIRTRGRRYARGLVRLARPSHMTTVARARSSASSVEVDCVLVHMAVVPHLRGAGVGAALLTAFVAQARRRGVARVRLLTSAGDVGASSFYEHMGWSAEGQQVDIDGKSWARYEYRL